MSNAVAHSADGSPRDLWMRCGEGRKAFLYLCGSVTENYQIHGDRALRLRVSLKVRVTHSFDELDGIVCGDLELAKILEKAPIDHIG